MKMGRIDRAVSHELNKLLRATGFTCELFVIFNDIFEVKYIVIEKVLRRVLS